MMVKGLRISLLVVSQGIVEHTTTLVVLRWEGERTGDDIGWMIREVETPPGQMPLKIPGCKIGLLLIRLGKSDY